jgi:hypothetical protein
MCRPSLSIHTRETVTHHSSKEIFHFVNLQVSESVPPSRPLSYILFSLSWAALYSKEQVKQKN